MKYFFDNCLPPRIAAALSALGVDCEHLRDSFPQDVKDVEWMPKVAARGLVAITGDERILKRPAEREARKECGLKTVFFSSIADLQIWPQVLLVMRAWPEIESWAAKARAGQCARVTANAKLEPLKGT